MGEKCFCWNVVFDDVCGGGCLNDVVFVFEGIFWLLGDDDVEFCWYDI